MFFSIATFRTTPFSSPERILSASHSNYFRKVGLTAHAPATVATIPPEIIIGRIPLVLLNSIPLRAPATILFAESCFPRICPIKELKPLYTMAITPAEFPKNGPLLVTAFSTEFNLNFGG
jgi:hypothetical protein